MDLHNKNIDLNAGTLLIDNLSNKSADEQSILSNILCNIDDHSNNCPRIITSISSNYAEKIKNNTISSNLFYRLNVIHLHVPSLNNRKEDLNDLIDYYLEKITIQLNRSPLKITDDALSLLLNYDWPGNIQQLINTIQSFSIIAANDCTITPNHLPNDIINPELEEKCSYYAISNRIALLPFKKAKHSFEREYLRMNLERFKGNISELARFMEIDRSYIHRKLKTLMKM